MTKLFVTLTFIILVCSTTYCQTRTFFEDFTDNRNNWEVVNSTSEITTIEEGNYKIKVPDTKGYHWFGIKSEQIGYPKYKIETLIIQTSKPNSNSLIGLILNSTADHKSHFVFLLDTEAGSFKLIKVQDKKSSQLIEWTKSFAVKKRNKIEVEKNGDNYRFFINDVRVYDQKIAEKFGTTFGYYAGPLTECEIEYVKIQGGDYIPNKIKDVFLDEDKGWSKLIIKNRLFSATFTDDFKSKTSSENWDLEEDGDGIASSKIENQRLKMRFNSKGRIGVTLAEEPMSLEENDFDIMSVFDKNSTSIYQGVIFGHSDSRNFASITFNASNKIMVYEKTVDGIVTGDDEQRNIYTSASSDNEVRVKKEKGLITVYFNGVKAYELDDIELPGDGVGIIAGGIKNMDVAYVKYFSAKIVSSTNSNAALEKSGNIVKVKKANGVYSVPVELNGVLKIDFIFDSGASDVSISPDVALTLIKTGTIRKEDWLEGAYYKFADGSTAKSKRFKLQSLKIGNKLVKNVVCSISNSIHAPMLLGQSILSKFGQYTFDNTNQRLIIE